jgi:hypothetical protein
MADAAAYARGIRLGYATGQAYEYKWYSHKLAVKVSCVGSDGRRREGKDMWGYEWFPDHSQLLQSQRPKKD